MILHVHYPIFTATAVIWQERGAGQVQVGEDTATVR
jgi:hypothetical protein